MGLDLAGEFDASNHIKKCRLIIMGCATNEDINQVTMFQVKIAKLTD